jgi:hypothetical protein
MTLVSNKSRKMTLTKLSGRIGTGPVGEPLNVIISGLSSLPVLVDDGFLNFARSIGLQVTRCSIHGFVLTVLSAPQNVWECTLGPHNPQILEMVTAGLIKLSNYARITATPTTALAWKR